MEVWKKVKGFEGYYEVSNLGRVRSVDRYILKFGCSTPTFYASKVLTPAPDKKGYPTVCLCINSKQSPKKVHRLVVSAFLVPVEGKRQVNHKDGDKANNTVSNLEWSTGSENVQHAHDTGLVNKSYGVENKTCKGEIEVYNSAGELVAKVAGNEDMKLKGFIPSCVCRVLSGKLKTHRGHTFRRTNVSS